eukprot:TRINITY_DN819_c0_g1_i1.p1 TRINITY_DN819_c0_g1~~TRINITY_DN819_c0_g1_i1.p1  ORF type:complete len:179 (-),score=30.28 TRINITY_DN819_c0_g1_i1:77-613(-)
MVALETLTHTFKHAWNEISFANWKKYPNPARPDVLSVDLLRRDFNPQDGVLTTRRLVIMKPALPAFLLKLTGASSYWYFVEDAVIDPKSNKMELTATNISFSQYIEMHEKCTYTPSQENSKWTHFEQQARVTSFTFGVSKKIEDFCVQTFKQNATKGRELMEQAILRVRKETEERGVK